MDWSELFKWICDEGCDLTFATATEAAEHFATVHPHGITREGPPCPLNCGWYGPPGHLRAHMKREHKRKRNESRRI